MQKIVTSDLLAVMRAPAKPRLGMRAPLWLDMTDDGDFNTNAARWIEALREPPTK